MSGVWHTDHTCAGRIKAGSHNGRSEDHPYRRHRQPVAPAWAQGSAHPFRQRAIDRGSVARGGGRGGARRRAPAGKRRAGCGHGRRDAPPELPGQLRRGGRGFRRRALDHPEQRAPCCGRNAGPALGYPRHARRRHGGDASPAGESAPYARAQHPARGIRVRRRGRYDPGQGLADRAGSYLAALRLRELARRLSGARRFRRRRGEDRARDRPKPGEGRLSLYPHRCAGVHGLCGRAEHGADARARRRSDGEFRPFARSRIQGRCESRRRCHHRHPSLPRQPAQHVASRGHL